MQTQPIGLDPPASRSAADRIGLAENFDSFLKLLTTQLTSQDPLAPLDANQFTQQLVQFTGVEQAIKTNAALGDLLALVRADQLARSTQYLGAEAEAGGETVRLGPERQAELRYRLDQPAARVTITVRNEAGEPVFATVGDGRSGTHALPWNGLDAWGGALPEGLYRVEIAATRERGEPVPVSTTIRGIIDGVEFAGDRVLLSIAGVLVPSEAITAIRTPAAG